MTVKVKGSSVMLKSDDPQVIAQWKAQPKKYVEVKDKKFTATDIGTGTGTSQ